MHEVNDLTWSNWMNDWTWRNWNVWIETHGLTWMNWHEWSDMNDLTWMIWHEIELKWMYWNKWIDMSESKWKNWNEWIDIRKIEINELTWKNWNEWLEIKDLKWRNWNDWFETNELKLRILRTWNEWIDINELTWRNWHEWLDMNGLKWIERNELLKLFRSLDFLRSYVINHLMTMWSTDKIELSLQSRAHVVNLIFEKWGRPDSFLPFLYDIELSLQFVHILSTSSWKVAQCCQFFYDFYVKSGYSLVRILSSSSWKSGPTSSIFDDFTWSIPWWPCGWQMKSSSRYRLVHILPASFWKSDAVFFYSGVAVETLWHSTYQTMEKSKKCMYKAMVMHRLS